MCWVGRYGLSHSVRTAHRSGHGLLDHLEWGQLGTTRECEGTYEWTTSTFFFCRGLGRDVRCEVGMRWDGMRRVPRMTDIVINGRANGKPRRRSPGLDLVRLIGCPVVCGLLVWAQR